MFPGRRRRRGKAVQVEHIRLTLVFESTWFVNQFESTFPLSKLWFQICQPAPLQRGVGEVEGTHAAGSGRHGGDPISYLLTCLLTYLLTYLLIIGVLRPK